VRTIIAGGRSVTNYRHLDTALNMCGWIPSVVLCGGAKGIDTMGAEWADSENIPIEYYLADWDKYGRKAGMIRNAEMANHAEALIAVWDGESKGTANMINIAKARKLKVYVQLV
jgi:hypothetical protein